MNKTIKQAERYEAPKVKEHVIMLKTGVLQTSIPEMTETQETWD